MKFIGLMIAAVLALGAVGAPAAASAAPAKTDPYSKDQIDKGMKSAPDVVKQASLPCDVADAAFISEGTGKYPDDPKGPDLKVSSYEIACRQGMGYVLQNYAGHPVKIFDCVSLAPTASPCRLPENKDAKLLLTSLVKATGRTCTVTDDRVLGGTKAGDAFFEVACQEGPGFIIKRPNPAAGEAPAAYDCGKVNIECKLTTPDQIAAATNKKVLALVAASGKPCQVTGSREVAQTTTGETYYEAACGNGTGFLIAAKDGAYARTIDCANARNVLGGCTLTDTTKAETAEAGTYTKLAAASGFPCQVSKYRYIGMYPKNNSEVVELQCSNRPDGRIALFPADNKGTAVFYDCVSAGVVGESCKLNEPATAFAHYTQALASKGKTTCKVSNAKYLAQTTDGSYYVETACSDGLPGWVIEETPAGSPKSLLTCGEAKASGVACTLPGNVK